ncbi:Krueppel like protein 1 [Lucilia cuprina]|nr:Krueppel like protein 1 [Lucilia cuprina]
MSDTTATATAKANNVSKSWPQEQNWIKDVLSKSGTELVQLTSNKAVKITKKLIKQNEKDSQNNTMVYYQSTPLIIKSEQPSQAQLCAPLRNNHDPQQQQHHPITNNSYY